MYESYYPGRNSKRGKEIQLEPMKKILFITLSNIGDVILTLPVLDYLISLFPQKEITVMAGPRSEELFRDNPQVDNLIIYDKHAALKDKIKLFHHLQKESFAVVVDLRNSFFGAFLNAQHKTSPFLFLSSSSKHMKDRHLDKVGSLRLEEGQEASSERKNSCLYISTEDEKYIELALREGNIVSSDKIMIISPGARSHIKRWSADRFVRLIASLIEQVGAKIVLVGDKEDMPTCEYIVSRSKYPILDLAGKTNLRQLAALIKKASCVITNDSAVLHLAGYLNAPTVAIFGPTDELKYGPWAEKSAVVKKDIFCRPCEKAQCRFLNLKCLQLVNAEDVLRATRNILAISRDVVTSGYQEDIKRILIVRTDRIGDLLLSTGVIKAVRDRYAHAYIAMMVSGFTKEIVDGNPYLDEVITYDKDDKHRSWYRSLKFSQNLKKKRFDLAIILHPTNRVHLITFLANIPRRVGYDRKLGFLLTDRLKHEKQLGEKHESEYNLDLIRYLGIEPAENRLLMPIKQESEEWAEELFKQEKINKNHKLVAIHPGASCPSKIWPNERFALVADKLVKKYAARILLVAGPRDIVLAENILRYMHHPLINLAGKTSLSQLASLLKRCDLFISNDSGPVHIASALGIPVISIFGRKQAGLGPVRWGPSGLKDRFLHKDVGCLKCLAHNCVKEFACLKAVTVDEVLKAADAVLK